MFSRRMPAFLALLFPILCCAASNQVNPPGAYFRTVDRHIESGPTLLLVAKGQPTFSILVLNSSDPVLATAAADTARYFRERWGSAPPVVHEMDRGASNLLVLSDLHERSQLPGRLREAVADVPALAEQAYVIRRVQLSPGRQALVCLGGSPVGARYAVVDLLRRMKIQKDEASLAFNSLRDEPYSTWRAVYINDSAHQMNNYNPNLVYNVNTFRWSPAQWDRFIDQLAFFRYNVLQIWITPHMFAPEALKGGGAFDYFRDTMRHVGRYAQRRGITLDLINGINATTEAGTRLDTQPLFRILPVYTYLNPNKPEEKALLMRLWDYWTKAIPEVGIWSLFPGDPGGCMDQGCTPATYVDLSLEVIPIIKRNNPHAKIDFTTWHFFGWGPDFTYNEYDRNHRVDRGYEYLMSKLDQFPADTTFGIELNDFTSEPGIGGSGLEFPDGSTAKYIAAISKTHLVHTWSYMVTEGEGWINHGYRVPQILAARDTEARFPISGGISYTMTPSFNLLNQFASSEAYWNPQTTASSIMQAYTEGIFGTSEQRLRNVFPHFQIAPMVGYTFEETSSWKPDYGRINQNMQQSASILESLHLPEHPRFEIMPTPTAYVNELLYFCHLYQKLCALGTAVEQCRAIVHAQPAFRSKKLEQIHLSDAQAALSQMQGDPRRQLQTLLDEIQKMDVPGMKADYRAKHYQIFLDHPSEFTQLLPNLINGFFAAFGGDFAYSLRPH